MTGAAKRDLALVAYGFNDARYTGAPTTFNVAEYVGDYRSMISGLIAAGYPANRIVIVAPYYILDAGFAVGGAGFTGQTRPEFLRYVDAAAQVAAEFGTFYIDMYAYMLANGGASLISGDNLHPNDLGHDTIKNGVLSATQLSAVPDVTAPVPITATNLSITENAPFSVRLYFKEPVTLSTRAGADTDLFTLSGMTLSLTAKDFETPLDADNNNIYVANLRAVDAAGNINDFSVSVTVTNIDESGAVNRLRLTTFQGMSESVNGDGYNYTFTSGAGYTDVYGRTSKALPSGQDGFAAMGMGGTYPTATNSLGPMIWLKTSSASQQFNPAVLGIYADKAGVPYKVIVGTTNVAVNGASVAPAANDIARVRRAGTSVFAEVSKDAGTSWTIVHTLTGQTTAALYAGMSTPSVATPIVSPYGSANFV